MATTLALCLVMLGPVATGAQTAKKASDYEPGHLAAARSFIDATATSDLTESVLAVFKPRVGAELRQQIPDVAPERFDRFMELFTTAFQQQQHLFQEASERVFADHLSKDDLEAGAVFYTSPAGRRFIEVRTELETAPAGAGQGDAELSIAEIAPHLTAQERAAFEAFAEGAVGRRIAAAQDEISRARARFGVLIGRHFSALAGAWAQEQMKKEGEALR